MAPRDQIKPSVCSRTYLVTKLVLPGLVECVGEDLDSDTAPASPGALGTVKLRLQVGVCRTLVDCSGLMYHTTFHCNFFAECSTTSFSLTFSLAYRLFHHLYYFDIKLIPMEWIKHDFRGTTEPFTRCTYFVRPARCIRSPAMG
jgi:hypothetical protein